MNKTISSIVILILVFLPCGGCNSPDHADNNMEVVNPNETQLFGLSISKPTSWDSITAEESKDRISMTKLEDDDIRTLVMLYASRPIVSLVKERWKIPLPAVQITVNPKENSPDISATDILIGFTKIGPNAFKNYAVINQPKEIEIDGHKAAYMKVHYTGESWSDANQYPVSYETWIVLRKGYFFMISAVSSQSEDDKIRSEIASIIKSIKLN